MKERFRAVDGQEALPTIQAFIEEVAAEGVLSVAGPVRETRADKGRTLVFDPPMQTFPGAFPVGLIGARELRIGEGEVNGRLPWLDGRDLTGRRTDGTDDPRGVPSLILEETPETGRRSWVCLLVTTVPGSSYDEIPEGEEGLTITHRIDLPAATPYGLDEEGRGLRPIAQLTWNAEKTLVERIRQILHFDQVYKAPQGDDPRPEWLAAG